MTHAGPSPNRSQSATRLATIGLALLAVLQVVVTVRSDGAAQAAGATTLVVWDDLVGAEGAAAEAVYAAFVAANPDLVVERRALTEEVSTTEDLQAALLSGVGPDLIGTDIDANFRQHLALSELLVPLNELPVPYGWADRIDGPAQRWARRGARLFALPIEQTYLGLVLNQTLLDEAGLRAPRTDAELLDLCQQARANGVVPIALGADPAAELSDLFVMVVNNALGANQTKNLLFTDWGLWNTSRVERAIRLVAIEMPNAGCYDLTTDGPPDARSRFAQGRTLILPASSSDADDLDAAMDAATLEMVPFPRGEGGRGRVLPTSLGSGYGLALRSAHPRESAMLLDFMVSPEAARIWVERGGITPPVGFDVGGWDLSPLRETVLDQSARARRRSLIRSTRVEFGYDLGSVAPAGFEPALATGLLAVLSGNQTPERVANDLQLAWIAERDAE